MATGSKHMTSRRDDIVRFYEILADLERKIGGAPKLADCSGGSKWPKRGVYFFFEEGEDRSDSGSGPKVVRVGTHALTAGSRTTLWTRLSQHKGHMKSGGGNHRGSIFRLIVGTAVINRDNLTFPTWGIGNTADKEVRNGEIALERRVSQIIGNMRLVWLRVEDEPGPDSLRGYIERNSIALLSNYNKTPLDRPSKTWLGHYCSRERVRKSGLWNQDHVDEPHNPHFLDKLHLLVSDLKNAA